MRRRKRPRRHVRREEVSACAKTRSRLWESKGGRQDRALGMRGPLKDVGNDTLILLAGGALPTHFHMFLGECLASLYEVTLGSKEEAFRRGGLTEP